MELDKAMNAGGGFSLIVPLYKGICHLDSILAILAKNRAALKAAGIDLPLELVLVNDYPADNEAVQNDARLQNLSDCRLVLHEKNTGIHQARIDGVTACRGEFITMLDQDDWIADNYFVSQYRALQKKKKATLAICNVRWVSPGRQRRIYKFYLSQSLATHYMVYPHRGNYIVSPGMVLMRRSAIPQPWMTKVLHNNGADDSFLWFLMGTVKDGFIAVANHRFLYHHIFTGTNCSEDHTQMIASIREVAEKMKGEGPMGDRIYTMFAYRMHFADETGKVPQARFIDRLCIGYWDNYNRALGLARKILKVIKK